MQIAPPFGYREVVPFLKTRRVRLMAAGEVPAFAQRGNAVPISYTEFQLVAREYPIAFTSGDGGKTFAVVAVLGIQGAENLFYSGGRVGGRGLRSGLRAPLSVLHGEGDDRQGGAEKPPDLRREGSPRGRG